MSRTCLEILLNYFIKIFYLFLDMFIKMYYNVFSRLGLPHNKALQMKTIKQKRFLSLINDKQMVPDVYTFDNTCDCCDNDCFAVALEFEDGNEVCYMADDNDNVVLFPTKEKMNYFFLTQTTLEVL